MQPDVSPPIVYLHKEGVVYLHMSDEQPDGDTYLAKRNRLLDTRTQAAESYAAQMLYLRLGGSYDRDTPRRRREQVAEEAAQVWMRLTAEIEALQAAEYRKKQAAS